MRSRKELLQSLFPGWTDSMVKMVEEKMDLENIHFVKPKINKRTGLDGTQIDFVVDVFSKKAFSLRKSTIAPRRIDEEENCMKAISENAARAVGGEAMAELFKNTIAVPNKFADRTIFDCLHEELSKYYILKHTSPKKIIMSQYVYMHLLDEMKLSDKHVIIDVDDKRIFNIKIELSEKAGFILEIQ
jgi:hypothetical protein